MYFPTGQTWGKEEGGGGEFGEAPQVKIVEEQKHFFLNDNRAKKVFFN